MYECGPFESWFLSYGHPHSTCPSLASTHDAACLTSDCLTCRTIPRVVRIISNPFCGHCCTNSCSTNSRLWRSHQIQCKEFKSWEQPGHAVGPPHPIKYFINTLFKNSRTASRKCGTKPSHTNHTWNPVCSLTSWNSSGRLFCRKSTKQPQSELVDVSRKQTFWLLQCLPIHLEKFVFGNQSVKFHADCHLPIHINYGNWLFHLLKTCLPACAVN
jgi:hypothetical protein